LVVSVVSVWEIVLKHQAGKLRFQVSLEEALAFDKRRIIDVASNSLKRFKSRGIR
jgi:PIN domain nuclease of toxin-antitoxin system